MANDSWQILLIDDNQDDYLLLRELGSTIAQRNLKIDVVRDYGSGLAAMRQGQYDLYLLDYFLDKGNGLDLLRAARQAGCMAPVIMLTGQSDHARDLEAMRAGASDYLIKGEVTATLLERSIRYALERRRVEEQLEASHEELQEAQRIAHLGSWSWDLQADVVTWSDEMYRIYGAQPQEFPITSAVFLDRIHPTDRHGMVKAIEKAYDDQVAFDYTHRLIRPDGTVRVTQGWGDVITDDDGLPVKMFGAEQDITERHESAQRLQLTQDQLRTVLDIVPGTVSWIDADLKYGGINQFLSRLYNLPPEAFIGQSLGFMNQDSAFVHFVEDFFASPQKTITREVPIRADDSDRVYLMVAQKYNDDQTAVFMGLDITERQQAAAALQQAHDELEARVVARTSELAVINQALQAEIAERQQAAQEAREGEQLYRTLINNFPQGAVLLFDHDLRYTIADGAAIRGNGKSCADFEGKTLWEATAPRVAATLEPYYRAALAGESHALETPIGEHIYQIQTLPVKNEDGAILAGMSLAQDITAHYLEEQRRNMRHTVTELLSQEASLEVTISDLLQVIAEGIRWDYGAFWQVGAGALRCFKTWHIPEAALEQLSAVNKNTVIVSGQGYLGQVWAEGRPRWVADMAQAALGRPPLRETQVLHGGIVFPVRFGGEILGVMEFFSIKAQLNDPEILNTLEGLGSQIGQFIARKRAQDALRASEALKSAILESSLDAILTMDYEGKIIDWNPGAERMFGYRRDEALGCAMVELILAPASEQWHLTLLRRYLETGDGPFTDQHLEFTATHADGHAFPVELGMARIQLNGHPLYTAYARDMTGRQRAARALQQAKDEAERALVEAERANRAKSEFLSRMSHELRTPMNSILGFSQLLQMEPLEPKQQQKIGHILKAGQHLLGLINEVLDIARVESGRFSLSLEPVRVEDTIRESLTLVEPLAGRRNITLEVLPAAVCDCSILADRQRLQQVLMNLLSNAIKYNHDGGKVTIGCRQDKAQHRLAIRIEDTGPGLNPGDLERVFQPFERLGAENSNIEGTGLGLALTKRFVEAMKGAIGVESVVGQGSVFWVSLPVTEDQMVHHTQSGGHAVAMASATEVAVKGNAGTVLYIEDNLANLLVVESILSYQRGIRLITAMQGGLGLELAREHHPALILLDLHLPDMEGTEVLSRLKADPQLQDIPVVVLSADATRRQIARLKTQGACNYLTKPLDVQQFLDVINEIL